jgi:transposase
MIHVGVDLDKRSSQSAVLTEDGEISQQRLPNDPGRLEQFFAELPPHTPVAIDASGTWWWLVDLLEHLGHAPILSHPKQTKAIAAARLKNDRVDAERLARLLRGDRLPTVWIPSAALREARELVRHRVQLVWRRGIVRHRRHAMLARRHLQPVSTQTWLTQRGQRELPRLPLADTPSRIRVDCSALLPLLDAQIRRLDGELGARGGRDPRVHRLTTIPGIGPFIAIVLVLELGDIARFPSAKQVASYVGLTPRIRASAAASARDTSVRKAIACSAGCCPRRHASGASARPAADLVPCGEKAAGQESRPGRAGAPTRGDRLSRLETRVRLLHRRPSRCRAGVSSAVDMVLGPPS